MRQEIYYALAGTAVIGAALLFTFERPPVETVQVGYRGTAMELVYNPRTVAAQIPANQPPPIDEPADTSGPRMSELTDQYENVQVLGDLSEGEFLRLMTAITNWVSPEQGCTYCHAEGEPLSSDSLYTKVVSRRMIQMTRTINVKWESHVAQTGVTCYTCHRGQPVPANIWFTDPGRPHARGLAGNPAGQNQPAPAAALASLPYDPFSAFLVGGEASGIRVIGNTALPTGNRQSTKQAEWTYSLMNHMSESLGVNCTYCHNSRSFGEWEQSPPQRATAWYGIRMVQTLNQEYLNPLQPVYPAHRLGPLGDAPKANCTTCHAGAYKPLYGAPMAVHYPELDRLGPPQAASLPAETPTVAQD